MPDADGIVSKEEQASFGILGRPPDEFWGAPSDLQKDWVTLQRDAKRVMRMWPGEARTDAAKQIAARRERLVQQIKEQSTR